MTAHLRTDCERFHRRDFLRLGTAGLLGLGLADLLRLEAGARTGKAAARSVILVWLAGGPATIDMWDLKPEAPEGVRGEFKPIATRAAGVRICEHLPALAKVMDRCVLVRSLHHSIAAHGPGTVYLTTGNRPSPAVDYPSLGSLASKLLPAAPGVPPYVAFRQARAAGFTGGAGYLGSAYAPFEVEGGAAGPGRVRVEGLSLPDGFSAADLGRRATLRDRFDSSFRALDESDLPASLDRFHQQALDILRSGKTRQAFDVSKEKPALRERYGPSPFARSALVARRLVEAGVRFVTIGLGGWDTHGGNFRTLRDRLLPTLDRGLAALIDDLDGRGRLGSTVVYCAGEFGRTPNVNTTAGRDHWARSMAVLLAGGGLKRGYAHGTTDAYGMGPQMEPCAPDDVSATIFHCLGVPPGHELNTTSGRPLALFRDGKVLGGLLA
jgi:hypothetical protein